MELKCAVVFALASLLSVTATPHGYGAKGGAVARADAGAAAGPFGTVGLPLSIQSGPGFSGSFSKSSSSSFASSSASSSSGSFSFTGSGANGFGLNTLGTPGTAGCSGGCQGDSKGINDSDGTGSAGYGLQTISGVKSNAAAGASAGSYINSKDGVQSPCSSGVCPGKKSQCEGPDCKDAHEACTSGQCQPNSTSETSLSDSNLKDCTSGHCNTNCENGKCSGNNNKPSYDHNNCASGHCGPAQTTDNFRTNLKCTSGDCANELSIASSSSTSHDSSQLSNTAKTSTSTSQGPGDNCKNGNCDSLTPNTKYPSYGYSNQNQPPTPVSSGGVTPPKPAIHLTAPEEEKPCFHPHCKPPTSTNLEEPKSTSSNLPPGNNNCEAGYCNNGQSQKYPKPNNNFSKGDSNAQVSPNQGGNHIYPTINCASGDCGNPSNSIPFMPKLPTFSQTYSPSSSDICATGNCGSHPSYHPDPDIQVSNVPIQTQPHGLDHLPNCPSGNCYGTPKNSIGVSSIHPTIPNYPYKQKTNENCPSGNCGNQFNSFPAQPKIPIYTQGHSPNSPNNCASGNCGSYPNYQNNFDISVSKVPIQSHVTDFSPYPSYPNTGNTIGPKIPVSSQQPPLSNPSNCALGNCQTPDFKNKHSVPGYSKEPSPFGTSHCQSGSCNSYPSNHNLGTPYPRLPSYPQNILPNKPLDCASGNCASHPSAEIHPSSSGPKYPSPITSSVIGSPACTSGTCGNHPTYQQGSYGSSGYQSPSYSGPVPATICASGNCAAYPSTSSSQSIGSTPSTSYTSSTGTFSLGVSLPTGPISSGNCASGKCPSYPTTQLTSQQAQPIPSSSPDKLPNFVALGVAGGVSNTGSFVPPSTSSIQPSSTASHTISDVDIVAGTHSQSSIFSHNNDKEQVYSGGFGGPPGILKPYEFSAPSLQLPSGNKKDQGQLQCSTGKCNTQSEEDSNKKYDLPSGPIPCTSGKCETESGKPHFIQSNTASGAFAAAAAGSEGVVYTGGFGGPPGILKPYDGGKIGYIATGANHLSGSSVGSNNDAVSGNKFTGGYGAFSGAAATANAGVFGTGSHGDHNKAGDCNSGCGSSGQGTLGGNFGVAGRQLKSDLLEKLHNGVVLGAAAQNSAAAISGAGASSFAVGGSFAGSSASAHSIAGSSIKGGYGR